ncbi:putative Polycomb group protein ASXL2 [Osmerus mordax]|uniref:putative Polycomb group protein ASXL2 n=1 Tax=Osmerus mordax TaxID=8014 RepID=UPI00350EF8B2
MRERQKRKKGRTWAEAAKTVLEKYPNTPMSHKEILQVIQRERLKEISGTSPLACLNAMLHTNSRGEEGIFYKVPGRMGVYTLKKDTSNVVKELSEEGSDESSDDLSDSQSTENNHSSNNQEGRRGGWRRRVPSKLQSQPSSPQPRCSSPSVTTGKLISPSQKHSKKALKQALRQQRNQRRQGGMPASSSPRLTLKTVKDMADSMATKNAWEPKQAEGSPASPQNSTSSSSSSVRAEACHSAGARNMSQRSSRLSARQLKRTKCAEIDVETPDSILVNTNLRALLNKHTFSVLPAGCQQKLLQMLPQVDQQACMDGHLLKVTSSALNNEFFTSAAQSWKERLAEGEFAPELQLRMRQEIEKEKKVEHWKERFFENYYGENSGLSYEESKELTEADVSPPDPARPRPPDPARSRPPDPARSRPPDPARPRPPDPARSRPPDPARPPSPPQPSPAVQAPDVPKASKNSSQAETEARKLRSSPPSAEPPKPTEEKQVPPKVAEKTRPAFNIEKIQTRASTRHAVMEAAPPRRRGGEEGMEVTPHDKEQVKKEKPQLPPSPTKQNLLEARPQKHRSAFVKQPSVNEEEGATVQYSPVLTSSVLASSVLVSPVPASSVLASPVLASSVLASSVLASPVLASPVLASPVLASPVLVSPVLASPVLASPVLASPVLASPVLASPVLASPLLASSVLASPVLASPVLASPVLASSVLASPVLASPLPASSVLASPLPASPVLASSVMASPVLASPLPASPVLASPLPASPVLASPVPASPVLASPVPASPVLASPLPASPVLASPPLASPVPPSPCPEALKRKSSSEQELELTLEKKARVTPLPPSTQNPPDPAVAEAHRVPPLKIPVSRLVSVPLSPSQVSPRAPLPAPLSSPGRTGARTLADIKAKAQLARALRAATASVSSSSTGAVPGPGPGGGGAEQRPPPTPTASPGPPHAHSPASAEPSSRPPPGSGVPSPLSVASSCPSGHFDSRSSQTQNTSRAVLPGDGPQRGPSENSTSSGWAQNVLKAPNPPLVQSVSTSGGFSTRSTLFIPANNPLVTQLLQGKEVPIEKILPKPLAKTEAKMAATPSSGDKGKIMLVTTGTRSGGRYLTPGEDVSKADSPVSGQSGVPGRSGSFSEFTRQQREMPDKETQEQIVQTLMQKAQHGQPYRGMGPQPPRYSSLQLGPSDESQDRPRFCVGFLGRKRTARPAMTGHYLLNVSTYGRGSESSRRSLLSPTVTLSLATLKRERPEETAGDEPAGKNRPGVKSEQQGCLEAPAIQLCSRVKSESLPASGCPADGSDNGGVAGNNGSSTRAKETSPIAQSARRTLDLCKQGNPEPYHAAAVAGATEPRHQGPLAAFQPQRTPDNQEVVGSCYGGTLNVSVPQALQAAASPGSSPSVSGDGGGATGSVMSFSVTVTTIPAGHPLAPSGQREASPEQGFMESPGMENVQSKCYCRLKAMIICKGCGAFCHDDCIGPSKLCVSCLVVR